MSFDVAISGLRAAAQDLKVIGNNVANANTTGFKQSRAEFSDVFAVANLGISQNATGSGVQVNRVAQEFTQGNVTFTDRSLDLAINGEGFFVVEEDGERIYTRAGIFGTDREGFIVNSRGARLVAYQADATGNLLGTLGPLQVPSSDLAPQASDEISLRVNLDPGEPVIALPFDATDPDTYNHSAQVSFFDSLGNSHLAVHYFRKTGANAWDTYLFVDGAAVDGPDPITFDSAGALATPATGEIVAPVYNPPGAAPITLTVDLSGSTQFSRGAGQSFSVFQALANGFPTGRLTGVDIDQQGVVLARFTNGQSQTYGQIALANFANTNALQPNSESNWVETFASGPPNIGAPGSSSLGLVQSGSLEESNVDLSAELVKLIVAQRNFQANAEVISTNDSITQAIINIR